MKRLGMLCLLLFVVTQGFGQLNSGDFKTTVINKKVKEFPLKIDLSTPFDSYLSREYLMLTGQTRKWREISTYAFASYFDPKAPDRQVSEKSRQATLNGLITEMVVYKDSAAAVLTFDSANACYFSSFSRLEEGKWVNAGQNMKKTLEDCRKQLPEDLRYSYEMIPIVERVKRKPADTRPFVDYLKKTGRSPEEFLLTALDSHKIVVYGEYHRRRPSWDLLKRVIRNKKFVRTTGTVFMELPSRMQPVLDRFFAAKEMDPELLLQVFREEQPYGWWDKDEFEFIIALWELNRTLKPSRRLKVVLADFQIPYSQLRTKEEFDNYPQVDRNLHMADVIEKHVKSSTDKRNHLFIVGCGHAYKSHVPGSHSTPEGEKRQLTAGAQLAQRFPAGEVFTIFQHVVASDNSGRHQALLRHGFFDRVFEEAGNRPVGFKLKGSPFGAEPFDGLTENTFEKETGRYEDNYDGYIFLQPLKEELRGHILYELFTDKFVEEMKRRAVYLGMADNASYWFGRKAQDLTPEYIKEVLRTEIKGEKKYPADLFE